MKKYKHYLLAIIVCFISINLFAQINFGFKGGLSHSEILESNDLENNVYQMPIAYAHLGVVANFPLSNNLAIQSELIFNQRGGKIRFTADSIKNAFFEHRYSYVSLPVLLEYKLKNLSLEVGPEFSYLLDSRIMYNGVNVSDNFWTTQNKFDVSLDIGAKYSFGDHLFTQLRWQRSLTPIGNIAATDRNGEPIDNIAFYTTSIQVSVGYKL